MDRVADALDGLSLRELERIRELIDQRLQSCVICQTEGALAVRVGFKTPAGKATFASLLLCRACLERHRLPDSRAKSAQVG